MSERISSPATRSAMPGSAQLPGELTKSVDKRSERRRPPNTLRKPSDKLLAFLESL